MSGKYFITGIGTGIGKTVASAILAERLKADYWKPIQSGDLDYSDSQKVKALISNPYSHIHPEQYRLTQPLSPHLSAKIDKTRIELDAFNLPETKRPLIVEGAGGLLVPLNEGDLIVNLIKKLNLPVIVVSQHYLGSINHSLLTLEVLKQHQIEVKGIIFNGEPNEESESVILSYSGAMHLGRIPVLDPVNPENVIEAGKKLTV